MHSREGGIEKAKALLEPLCKAPKPIRCPFPEHDDHRAGSARLWPDHFYCFVCLRGGDSLDYYCLTEGLSISDALRRLGVTSFPLAAKPSRPRPSDEDQALLSDLTVELAMRMNFAKEWALAKMLAPLDETLVVESFTSPTLAAFCRKHDLDPLLIHDCTYAIRSAA